MARQRTPVQVNQFVGGINTEANLLAYPDNSSLDESNMEMLKNGARVRRNGFDVETDYVEVNTGINPQLGQRIGRGQFRWEAPGGVSSKEFIVVQLGNYVAVHDIDDSTSISNGLLYSATYASNTYGNNYGFASIEGKLVIATGTKLLNILSYDEVGGITATTDSLLIRDFFGVEAEVGGVALTDLLNVQKRPSTKTDAHIYNLRNQTWALPRVEGDANTVNLVDCITEFRTATGNTLYPSNADSVIPHLYPNANYTNGTVDRFNAADLWKTPPGTTKAPTGYFIIDAMERGVSRLAQEAELRANNSVLGHAITNLPGINDEVSCGGR